MNPRSFLSVKIRAGRLTQALDFSKLSLVEEHEMKRILLAAILLSCIPAFVFSEWVSISLEGAVRSSDRIVIGILNDALEETKGDIDYGQGEIVIEEVLLGEATPRKRLSLVWRNNTDIDCPRVEHKPHQGKKMIWLLQKNSQGEVTANNPGRVVPMADKEKVVEVLRAAGKI